FQPAFRQPSRCRSTRVGEFEKRSQLAHLFERRLRLLDVSELRDGAWQVGAERARDGERELGPWVALVELDRSLGRKPRLRQRVCARIGPLVAAPELTCCPAERCAQPPFC